MSDDVNNRIRQIVAELREDADGISERYDRAPVAIIVAGSQEAAVPRCVTVFSNLGEGREGRMRDQLGILQASIQIEALNHLRREPLQRIAKAVRKIAEETNTEIDL